MRICCFAESTISGCKEGRMDVVEDWTYSFTCSAYINMKVVWTIYSDKEKIVFRGFCQFSSCTYGDYNDFIVKQSYIDSDYPYYYTSTLTTTEIKRDARILNCSSSSESTACELRIIGKLLLHVYKLLNHNVCTHLSVNIILSVYTYSVILCNISFKKLISKMKQ